MINQLDVSKKTVAAARKTIRAEKFLPKAVQKYLIEGMDDLAKVSGYTAVVRYGEPSIPDHDGEVFVAIHLRPIREGASA